MTAPFTAAAPAWLAAGPVEHEAGLVVAGHTLPIESGTVTFHGANIPSYTGTITVPLDATTAGLFFDLDPRRGTVAALWAGYTFPTGVRDVRRIGTVYPTALERDPVASTLVIGFASAESLLDQAKVLYPADAERINRVGITEAVSSILGLLLPTASFGSTVPARTSPELLTYDVLEIAAGDDWLNVLEHITQAADTRLYVDRAGVWRLTQRVDTPTPAEATVLATGENGTLTRINERIGLDEWANSVQVTAPLAGSDPVRQLTTVAERTDGPTGVDAAPRRTITVKHEHPLTVAAARRRARTILSRVSRLGAGFNLEGVAHYWLTPDSTVAIQRPNTGTVTQLVRNVTYDLSTGSMSLSTREDTTPIITDPEDSTP